VLWAKQMLARSGRGRSNGNVGANLERACRTCPGLAPARANPYTGPRPKSCHGPITVPNRI